MRGGSHRCRTSKAKNMEKTAPKQLEDAEVKEEEGEDVEDNHRKGPMADRVDNIGAAFSEDAERRMSKAVEKTRNTFAKRKPKVPTQEEGEDEYRILRQLGEEGKVAVRNVRQKLMQELGRLERDSKVSSDEQHMLASSVQQLTDKHVAILDELIEQRSAESTKV
ncbi:hypothetical protein WJX74_002609 [Apatococcus lobatus]|uniref:Ribosome recycling factor domain-containing protein n=2 Tax=Apatococcus TaxID=904362 RepID=A0AAW1TCH2_9CHLO